MNARLSQDFEFSAALLSERQILPVKYDLTIDMVTQTDNPRHQNVAIQRIIFFITQIMDGNVYTDLSNCNFSKIKKLFPENLILEFPERPYEQLVGTLLFHKLSAITEGKLVIDELHIGSNHNEGLIYTIEDYSEFLMIEGEPVWWDKPTMAISKAKRHQLAKVKWEDAGLGWEPPKGNDLEFVINLEQEEETAPDVEILDGGDNDEDEEMELSFEPEESTESTPPEEPSAS